MKSWRNLIVTALIWCVRGYQIFVSPFLPRVCKYYPSCSQYAIDAIRQFGPARGVVLAAWRLLRCNPLSMGGYDPVEQQKVFGRRGRAAATDTGSGAPAPGRAV
ncbi:MAG: membrane protein insertion efficiency factor YidD [Thermoleophilia bacterium]|nr:membrane protein insertion efficiency factor YidD [Thermoleophilia bacterium]